jgi:uncharacterized protein (TIGR02117 family)
LEVLVLAVKASIIGRCAAALRRALQAIRAVVNSGGAGVHRILLPATMVLVACQNAMVEPATSAPWPPRPGEEKIVYLLSHGWHTGIVVQRAEIREDLWPEKADFPDLTYLEVGWGDEAFYRARENTLFMALEAALTPTRSVVHVVGFNGTVTTFFANSGIVELPVSEQGLHDLVRYIHDTIERESGPTFLGSGLQRNSRFYRAVGSYSLFNNCNDWAARALARSGAPVEPSKAMTASALFEQVSQLGQVMRAAP